MFTSQLFNFAYIFGALVGAGGIQFLLMHRYQRRQLQAQAEQSEAAAENSDVNSAQVIQSMAMAMLQHKEAELTACDNARKELQRVVAALVAYIQGIPELPAMPPEIAAIIKGWS